MNFLPLVKKIRNAIRPSLMVGCAFAGMSLAGSKTLAAGDAPRTRLSLDADWRFHKEDAAGVGDSLAYDKLRPWLLPAANAFVAPDKAANRPTGDEPGKNVAYVQPGFDDNAWRKLDLPHDWAIEGPFDQEYRGETGKLPFWGVGWYRKSFDVSGLESSGQCFLQVDGAMSYSAVWLNGHFVGGWPYGYASYQLDLTPYVRPGANVLAIRLDNPKDSSRWYPGGGIYRHLWLLKTGPVHFEHWRTQITTPDISPVAARVNVATRLNVPAAANLVAAVAIYETDASGSRAARPVVVNRFPFMQKVGEPASLNAQLVVSNPKLWSPDKPALYVAVTYVLAGEKIIDQEETPFGIRTLKWSAADGLQINGARVPIRGVCLHHDLGALGAAVNTRAMQRQIEILKEAGVNAVRTSHNPPAPEFLDLCDQMGILVMDESFDCWRQAKKPNGYNRLFDDWSERDLRAEVRRDRNHPCIILWSLGNEILEQSSPQGPAMEKELARYVHEEDPTRPTTIGVSDASGGYNGFQTGIDVLGYNYKPGEYKKFREKNPAIPLFGSETSSTVSSRGEYFFPVSGNHDEGKSDFQVSSYDRYYPGWATSPDTEFKGQEENPFVAGEFVWTGFDYLGEPTPYDSDSSNLLNYHTPEAKAAAEKQLRELGKIKVPARSSYFGIVDLAGFKKDRFYLYQAHWRPEFPMAHLLPHWNWPDRVGEVTPVQVYTSGDEAELFLNGKSLGRKKKGKLEYRLQWDDVKYEPGELKVVTYKGGNHWADDVVRTTGPAEKLFLRADRGVIRADGRDLAYVTATITDKNGLPVPRSANRLKFEVSGPAEIVATDNGDPTDQSAFQSPERKAFNGLALVILRGTPGPGGPITLRATGEGVSGVTLNLRSVP